MIDHNEVDENKQSMYKFITEDSVEYSFKHSLVKRDEAVYLYQTPTIWESFKVMETWALIAFVFFSTYALLFTIGACADLYKLTIPDVDPMSQDPDISDVMIVWRIGMALYVIGTIFTGYLGHIGYPGLVMVAMLVCCTFCSIL